MRKRRVRIETQRGRRATRGDLQMHGGGTSTDGKKCNGRQRDSKREKKSRPLVVKAPSRSLPPAVSLFFAPSFSLSLSLCPSHADSFSTVAAVRGSFAEVEAKQLEWP